MKHLLWGISQNLRSFFRKVADLDQTPLATAYSDVCVSTNKDDITVAQTQDDPLSLTNKDNYRATQYFLRLSCRIFYRSSFLHAFIVLIIFNIFFNVLFRIQLQGTNLNTWYCDGCYTSVVVVFITLTNAGTCLCDTSTSHKVTIFTD